MVVGSVVMHAGGANMIPDEMPRNPSAGSQSVLFLQCPLKLSSSSPYDPVAQPGRYAPVLSLLPPGLRAVEMREHR
jgi:hypothetical protein